MLHSAKYKKALSLVLALALILSLSPLSFADGAKKDPIVWLKGSSLDPDNPKPFHLEGLKKDFILEYIFGFSDDVIYYQAYNPLTKEAGLGLMSITGEIITQPEFSYFGDDIVSGTLIAEKPGEEVSKYFLNAHFGLFDKKGRELIPPIYDEILYIDRPLPEDDEDIIPVEGKFTGLVRAGNILIDEKSKPIGDRFGIFNLEGKNIVPVIFDRDYLYVSCNNDDYITGYLQEERSYDGKSYKKGSYWFDRDGNLVKYFPPDFKFPFDYGNKAYSYEGNYKPILGYLKWRSYPIGYCNRMMYKDELINKKELRGVAAGFVDGIGCIFGEYGMPISVDKNLNLVEAYVVPNLYNSGVSIGKEKIDWNYLPDHNVVFRDFFDKKGRPFCVQGVNYEVYNGYVVAYKDNRRESISEKVPYRVELWVYDLTERPKTDEVPKPSIIKVEVGDDYIYNNTFKDGMCWVAFKEGDFNSFGAYNYKGELVIPPIYPFNDEDVTFKHGLCEMGVYTLDPNTGKNVYKKGFIDKSGRVVVPPDYGYVLPSKENAFVAANFLSTTQQGELYYEKLKVDILDTNGKICHRFDDTDCEFNFPFKNGKTIVFRLNNKEGGAITNNKYVERIGYIQNPAANTKYNPAEGRTAKFNLSKVRIGDKDVELPAYLIGGSNFVKLRDLAIVFNKSPMSFSVEKWDGKNQTVHIGFKQEYKPVGGELNYTSKEDKKAKATIIRIYDDKKTYPNYWMTMGAYNIGGNNYVRLRDVCTLLKVKVDWDEKTRSIKLTHDPSLYGTFLFKFGK